MNYYTQRIFWRILVLYILFGMHFFMHNPGGAGLYLPFNMMGWVFVSLLISVGIWHLTQTKQLVFSQTQRWFLVGFTILLLPFLNLEAEWNVQALPRFFAIAAGLLLFFSLSQFQFSEKQRYDLLYLLLGAIAIEAVYGLIQFFVLKEGNWFGYNFQVNRPYGIFQKDTVFSSFLAVGIALSFYLQRWDISFNISKCKRFLVYFVLFTSTFLLIQIQSRTGIIGAFLVLIILSPVIYQYSKKKFFLSHVIILIGLLLGFYFLTSIRNEHYESYYMSAFYRIVYWKQVLKMFSDAPFLGYGYGGFEYNFLHSYRAVGAQLVDYDPIGNALDHPHNEVIFWLLEGGLVAVVGLLVFATGYIRTILKCDSWAKRASLFALVLPLLFHSMVEYPFYHSVTHFFLFIVLLWLADAESGLQKIYVCKYWFLARMVAILVPLVVIPFMLTGLQEAYILTKYDRMKNKEPMILEQIVNPFPWFALYDFDMHSLQFVYGSAFHNEQSLNDFVFWAKRFVHSTPRAIVYLQIVKALEQLGKYDEAEKWLAEGQRLFPRNKNLQAVTLNTASISK